MREQYRVVTDHYAGYEVQKRARWIIWGPWCQVPNRMLRRSVNTFSTEQKARAFIEQCRRGDNKPAGREVWREADAMDARESTSGISQQQRQDTQPIQQQPE